MKIALEARPIQWSSGTGIGNYTYCLIASLSALDTTNPYTFLWPDDNPSPWIPFEREYSYYALPKDDEREEMEIPQWLNQEKADLFHLPQNGFRAPKDVASKIIVTIHDLIPYILPEIVRTSFLKRFITEMPQVIERSDHIITVSQTSKQDIIRIFGVGPERISVIPAAPSEEYRLLPPEWVKATLFRKFHLERPYILYVGGLNPRKNVAELICAYAKIHHDLARGELLVIPGPEGRHLNQLRFLAKALRLEDDVVFPGFVASEMLPFFYNGARLFVYPSLYEGFGLPPIEAMACGAPVIVSNAAALPEVVDDAALLINPYDTMQLAEAIHKVLHDPNLAQALITKGLKQSRKYSWRQNASRILEIYRQVINW